MISLLRFTNFVIASADNGWLESMADHRAVLRNMPECSESLCSNRYFTRALFAFKVRVWSAANIFGSIPPIPPAAYIFIISCIRLPCSESVRIEATSASFKLSTFTVSLSLFSVFLNRSERVLVSSVRSAAPSDFKASVTSASIRLTDSARCAALTV